MRLIAIQTVEGFTSVVYRWLDEPLIRPRVLVESKESLTIIYQKLQNHYFHREFTPEEFVVVVNEHEPPDLETVFAGFRVMRLPGVRFGQLVYAAAPFDPSGIEQSLSDFVEVADNPEKARAALSEVLHAPIHITGFSRAAVAAVRALPELPFDAVIVAPRDLDRRGLPVIVAVGSDPGMSREEMQLMEDYPFCALVVINIEGDPGLIDATLDFITNNIAFDLQPSIELFRLISEPYTENLQIWHTLHRVDRLYTWFRGNFSDKDIRPISDVIKSLNHPRKSE